MTVRDLLVLLDGVNPDYEIKLDLPDTDITDAFITDPATKCIYIDTIQEQ